MFDLAIVTSLILFAVAVGFGVEYYRRIVEVKREYEKAKVAFNDMLLSFSRELKRAIDGVENVTLKVGASSARSEEALNTVKMLEERLKALENKISEPTKSWNGINLRINNLEKQLSDITVSNKELSSKISLLEEKIQQAPAIPEPRIEAAIPIKRERALAHLTNTELTVLELLAAEGPKTAPEIKDRIKLSREHTARLMKKLYEEGYLERDSSKIPFKYSVKREMEEFLKKA